MGANPQFSTDLAKFTEEIFDRKLNFSCTEQIAIHFCVV